MLEEEPKSFSLHLMANYKIATSTRNIAYLKFHLLNKSKEWPRQMHAIAIIEVKLVKKKLGKYVGGTGSLSGAKFFLEQLFF